MENMTNLSVSKLSVTTSNNTILDNVDLCVAPGDITAIIGPNGAGKTTLLNAVRGDVVPTHGEISICGHRLNDWQPGDLAKHLAVLPQQSLLNFPFPVYEVIMLGRIPHASGAVVDQSIINEIAQLLDITHLLNCVYTRLSGGEKQRVQLARVMAQIWRAEDAAQRLLLLDEPTSALDPGHQIQLMQLIESFAAQEVAVVMVMHDIDLAAAYASKILALKNGQTIADGSADHVITPDTLNTLFNVNFGVIEHPDTGCPVLLKSSPNQSKNRA